MKTFSVNVDQYNITPRTEAVQHVGRLPIAMRDTNARAVKSSGIQLSYPYYGAAHAALLSACLEYVAVIEHVSIEIKDLDVLRLIKKEGLGL